MFSRRHLMFTATAALFATLTRQALAAPLSPNDPQGIVTAIYTRAAMDQLVVDNLLSWVAGKGPLTPVPETAPKK